MTKLAHRAAALLLAAFFAGHTVGTFAGRSLGPAADAVLLSMRTVRFDFNGTDRTLGEILFGHGLLVSLYLLGSALLAWRLSSTDDRRWPTVAPIAWGLALAQVATAGVAATCFFAGPAVITATAAGLLLAGNLGAARRASGAAFAPTRGSPR